jgi:hypothetical protein
MGAAGNWAIRASSSTETHEELHGGLCFQSGIGPGAEQFVTFHDVYNAETADKKLQELLPQLSELLESLDRL